MTDPISSHHGDPRAWPSLDQPGVFELSGDGEPGHVKALFDVGHWVVVCVHQERLTRLTFIYLGCTVLVCTAQCTGDDLHWNPHWTASIWMWWIVQQVVWNDGKRETACGHGATNWEIIRDHWSMRKSTSTVWQSGHMAGKPAIVRSSVPAIRFNHIYIIIYIHIYIIIIYVYII